MKITVDRHDFSMAFQRAGRADQFSSHAMRLLFEYFEEYEESTGEEIELDPVAICCEYCEETPADIVKNYSIDLSSVDPEDLDYDQACVDIVREYLEENTQLVGETASGFVYAAF